MAAGHLDALVDALRRLPGVGVKSAQRMAFHLLQHDRAGAQQLARALEEAVAHVRHCSRCHTFTDDEVCAICRDASRDARLLCVVESPADQAALERTGSYRGCYYVLMGRTRPQAVQRAGGECARRTGPDRAGHRRPGRGGHRGHQLHRRG